MKKIDSGEKRAIKEITVFREASRRKRAERVLEKKFCPDWAA